MERLQPVKLVLGLVVIVLLVLLLNAVKDLKPRNNKLGFSQLNSLASTSTVAVVGSSSTLIVASSTGPHFICNTGNNNAYVAFATSITTSSALGANVSRGHLISTSSNNGINCQGPFDYIGQHAAHTLTGTTSLQMTSFP